MSQFEFFMSCYRAATETYNRLVETPRAKSTQYVYEIEEIKNKINTAIAYQELTKDEGSKLLRLFNELKFAKIPQIRAEKARAAKLRGAV